VARAPRIWMLTGQVSFADMAALREPADTAHLRRKRTCRRYAPSRRLPIAAKALCRPARPAISGKSLSKGESSVSPEMAGPASREGRDARAGQIFFAFRSRHCESERQKKFAEGPTGGDPQRLPVVAREAVSQTEG